MAGWQRTAAANIAFVALQFALDIQTGLAGLFVTGMAGGVRLGGEMARDGKDARQGGA